MFYFSYGTAAVVMNTRVDEAQRQENQRLLRQQVQDLQQSWLDRQRRMLAGSIGQRLIAVGMRLEHYAWPQSWA